MVTIKNPQNYKLLYFEKSHKKYAKYNAVLENKITKKLTHVPFGDKRYQHYKDQVNLKLYSHLDHKDKKRRKLYQTRHKSENLKKFSSGYFSWYYLW